MILIIGSGLSGAVLAERFANILGKNVLVLEKREHIGGNCYDYIDDETGIRLNKYGPHLFHTNNDIVWNYIQKFADWKRWDHSVLSKIDNRFVPVPVCITSVNILCNQNIKNEDEMNSWLLENQVKYDIIDNSEKMCKSRVGDTLFQKLFRPYTIKQWAKEPYELDPSVLSRIPVRNNFDIRYFNDKYQALPKDGYTSFINNMLSNPLIKVQTDVDFIEWRKTNDLSSFEYIFYTGPIDSYFSNLSSKGDEPILDKLEYRSIFFKEERFYNMGFYQPVSQVNYPNMDVSFTRITEYKHFLNQDSPHTIIVKEFTTNDGEPYYPVPSERNIKLFNQYQELAKKEEITNHVYFVGRLANYKYFNMDEAIFNALTIFEKFSN